MTLWDRLIAPPLPDARLSVWQGRGFRDESWASAVRAGERAAVGLRKLGVQPGTRVACVLTNSFDVCAGILGIWLAGGIVLSLPTPARAVAPDEYMAQLERLCESAGTSLLLLDETFAAGIPSSDGLRAASFGRLAADGRLDPCLADDDEPAFVQYSSGSTSNPKGCVLTPRAIAAQLDMLAERTAPEPGRDGVCSWLPLSHDMGFFGGLLWPWTHGLSLTMSDPLRFLRSPRTWLDDCAASEATVTVGPNFGLGLVTRAARRRPPAGPLSLRTWIVGSDPIDAGYLADAMQVLAPYGLPSTALTPAYGLAEATLGVTMVERHTEAAALPIALDALYEGEVREPADGDTTTRIVSTGPPLAGVEVRVDGSNDVGEIVVESPSLATGYLNDLKRSARGFPSGELRTGDLGFVRDGELYVIGRRDDVISVGGRNIHATELESRLGEDPRVRTGTCALVDVNGAGARSLVVLSEPADDDVDFTATARSLRRIVSAAAGIGINECVFVRRGTLPKSPSGKVQRHRCRRLANGDGSAALARVRVD
jgi:fatty-acyl-CoA synthase